nr:gag pol polyprotein [Hymenolepis microstoma]
MTTTSQLDLFLLSRCHRMSSETDFDHAIAAPPTNVVSLVFDIVDDASEDIRYGILKRTVTRRLSVYQEKRFQQLLSLVHLGDGTPSQLHYIQSLPSGTSLDGLILRQLWSECFPVKFAELAEPLSMN